MAKKRGSVRTSLLEVEWGVRFWIADYTDDSERPVTRNAAMGMNLRKADIQVRGLGDFAAFIVDPPAKPVIRLTDQGRMTILDLTYFLEALEDSEVSDRLDPGGASGAFELVFTPKLKNMRSTEPAGPNIGRVEVTDPNAGQFMDVMLRILRVRFELQRKASGSGFQVVDGTVAAVRDQAFPERGPHGVAIVETTKAGLQRILVDWKPDWLRMTSPVVRPRRSEKHQRDRTEESIGMIALHNISGATAEGKLYASIGKALSEFLGKSSDSGTHYIVDADGHVVKLSQETVVLKHAGGTGKAQWGLRVEGPPARKRFRDENNAVAIGIEHVLFKARPDFPAALIRASVDLVNQLQQRFSIAPWDIVGHGEINTDAQHRLAEHRFVCPGLNFPWHTYELANLVTAPAAVPEEDFRGTTVYGISEGGTLDKRDDEAVKELSRDLHQIGYAVPETKEFEGAVRRAVNRFQARFLNGSRPYDYFGQTPSPTWSQDLAWEPSEKVDWKTAIQIKRVLRSVPAPPP